MAFVIADGWLYIEIDGKFGIYGQQEVQNSLQSDIKSAQIAFLDYQTRAFSTNDERDTLDAQINSVFGKDYLVVQERISVGLIQIIAAKKEKIEEIYRCFHKTQVTSLVPYAVALRAILKSKNIFDSHKRVIFLDDLNNQPVVTFFDDMRFSAPRRINMLDSENVLLEIKRSLQNFISEGPDKQCALSEFVLISNNRRWQSDLFSSKFIFKESLIDFNVPFPAIQGLKEAKFTLHFALIDQILQQKKLKIWKSRFKVMVTVILLSLAGLGVCWCAVYLNHQEQMQSKYLISQINQYKLSIANLYQKKFLSYFRSDDFIDYRRIYYDFVEAVPSGYLIDSFKLIKETEGNWSLKAIIYPDQHGGFLSEFRYDLFYPDTKLSAVITHKVLGQEINTELKVEEY